MSKLKGTTLMVYMALIRTGETGVRDLQRQLAFSSPSVAQYHLEKLVDLGLASNQRGRYALERKADIPFLSAWVLLGSRLLPRAAFAAVFFTALLVGYLALFYTRWTVDSFFVLLVGGAAALGGWVEVGLQYKHKPV